MTTTLVEKRPHPYADEKVVCHDNDEHDGDSSSVDTQSALLDFLGLPQGGDLPCLEVEEEVATKSEKDADATCRIELPSRCSRHSYPPENCLAIRVHKFFSRLECQQLIEMATSNPNNGGGFQYITEAQHTDTADGAKYSVLLQNPNPHKLSVFYHSTTINRMWRTVQSRVFPLLEPFLKQRGCGSPIGLNPKLRVLMYDSSDNDRFEPHFDATTKVGVNKKSLITVLLYLNDGDGKDFKGGETLFLNHHISQRQGKEKATKVVPSTGDVVIFEHDLYHSGAPLEWGTKYVLRTDILFEYQDEVTTSSPKQSDGSESTDKTAFASVLISDLCQDLGFSDDNCQRLSQMGLSDMTIDSFLSPGDKMLRAMLEECLDVSLVNELLTAANRLQNASS
jgi:hypothetical protein